MARPFFDLAERVERRARLIRFVPILRQLTGWLEERHWARHRYVVTDEMVERDVQRILEPWPDGPMTLNTIYCRSSMGRRLYDVIPRLVKRGVVKEHPADDDHPTSRYSWVK